MSISERIAAAESIYTRLLERAVASLLVVLVVLVTSQVVARSVFSASLAWSDELSRLCLAWLTFIGAAVVVQRGSHVKVDLVSDLLRPRPRALLDLVVHGLMLAFIGLLLWTGPTIIRSTSTVDMPALGWPTSLMHLAPFIGAAAMVPYILCHLFRRAAALRVLKEA